MNKNFTPPSKKPTEKIEEELCRYSIINNNKPKEKLARLGETWNHKSRMTVCATNWQMP